MSVKCSGCGLVNFAQAEVCRRCKSPLAAPATYVPAAPSATTPPQGERAIVGPFDTRQGFKAWYVVALPHALIAVPLSFWPSLLTGMGAIVRSAMGRLIPPLFGGGYRDEIADAPEAELRSRPGALVFPIAELSAIGFKEPLLAGSSVFNRKVTTQGLGGAQALRSSVEMRLRRKGRDEPVRLHLSDFFDFPEFFAELNPRYPGLCRMER